MGEAQPKHTDEELRGHAAHSIPNIAYEKHRPEKTLIYQIVQANLNTFLAQCQAAHSPLPEFVTKEFDAYLKCGILAHGFARIYCANCKFDRLVAFSCKRRGFCASCTARRQNETAAHLVDEVIPKIPTAQWVLSIPKPLRHLLSYDSEALNMMLRIFSKTVFRWLRKKARRSGIVEIAADAHPGAVTFIQRFGSALDLNTHFHSIFSAGVYTEGKYGEMIFHQLPNPTIEEIREIAGQLAEKVNKWLEKCVQEIQPSDEFCAEQPLLARCYEASVKYQTAFGQNAGKPLMRAWDILVKSDREKRTVGEFNLHVSQPIGENDRAGLERQLRYMSRPPLSDERLSKMPDGRLVIKLKKNWSDGTSHIVLTPMDFMARLVALIPPPRKNQIRYHGIFAPNAKLRSKVVPKKEEPEIVKEEQDGNSASRKAYAKMMARVFSVDILKCPKCESKMQTISFITNKKAITDILASLKLATGPPEIAEAAFVAEQTEIIYDYLD